MPNKECRCCACVLTRALEAFHAKESHLEKYLAIDGLMDAIDAALPESTTKETLWMMRAKVLEKKGVLEKYLFEGGVKH